MENLISSKGLKAFQIAALMIFAAHIASGAVISRHIASDAVQTLHISDGAITTDKVLNAAITYDKLDANVKALLNSELTYVESTRIPTVNDDINATSPSGVTFLAGSVLTRRAKWLYKPSSNSADWEVYECVDNTASQAVWILSTLTNEDLGNLALMNKDQLEQSITITSSRISDFSAQVESIGDAKWAQLIGNNIYQGTNSFQNLSTASIEMNGEVIDGKVTEYPSVDLQNWSSFATNTFIVSETALWNVTDALVAYIDNAISTLTTTINDTLSASYVAKADFNTLLTSNADLIRMQVETVSVSTTGATEISYTPGEHLHYMLTRNGAIFNQYATHDVNNSKFTFTDYPVENATDKVELVRFFYPS